MCIEYILYISSWFYKLINIYKFWLTAVLGLAVRITYLLLHLSFKLVDDSFFLLNSAVKAWHMLACFTWSPVCLSKPLLHHPNLEKTFTLQLYILN